MPKEHGETNQIYMRRAIELAKRGEGWCHPNPMVGAVIVREDRIIGEGYHARCGELHAERNALASLTESAEGATIYVTLEPCCHHGKTPPCTEAIIEHGIRRVVIGSRDPNPKVAGGGVKALREAGIEVVEDVLRKECDALNPVFFHYIQKSTPYVMMKYAMTADGKIATKTGASKWITGEAARARVQEMRHACMGIMVGIGTVLADDPMLNCRLDGGRDPVRIICDSSLRTPIESQICRTSHEQETIITCALPELPAGWIDADVPLQEDGLDVRLQDKIRMLTVCGARILNVPGEREQDTAEKNETIQIMDASDQMVRTVDLRKLMTYLGEREIDSILLEGGATLNAAALSAGIVCEVDAFIAPKLFGGTAPGPVAGAGVAVPADAPQMELIGSEQIGEDILLRYRL